MTDATMLEWSMVWDACAHKPPEESYESFKTSMLFQNELSTLCDDITIHLFRGRRLDVRWFDSKGLVGCFTAENGTDLIKKLFPNLALNFRFNIYKDDHCKVIINYPKINLEEELFITTKPI